MKASGRPAAPAGQWCRWPVAMNFWLINISEPLPGGGPSKGLDRLLRTGLVAELLVERGHQVVFWSSDFNHFDKTFHTGGDARLQRSPNFQVRTIHSLGYRKNVSLRRILDHRGVARKFSRFAREEARPDLILASMPSIELCEAATHFGREQAIPVVLDLRDLWPDIFIEAMPGPLRGAARLACWPLRAALRRACAQATAILGITPAYLQWGLAQAGRPRGPLDRDFALAYPKATTPPGELEAARRAWRERGIGGEGEFLACFFGTMSSKLELDTVIAAARELQTAQARIQIVLCGQGDDLEHLRQLARGCSTVSLPGWVSTAEVTALMEMAQVGLAPYRSRKDFTMSIPTKVAEYLSRGLPIVSSLDGALKDLLTQERCGLVYGNQRPDQLAACLQKLMADPGLRQGMSQKARELFASRFDRDLVYNQMADHLEAIARQGGAAR